VIRLSIYIPVSDRSNFKGSISIIHKYKYHMNGRDEHINRRISSKDQ